MPLPKRDLQIICNIQWKSKQGNGGEHKANIVGFCDMPATTLSWEHFKSYLLTNSGISEDYDDIIVYYKTEDGSERAIQSQIDFQIALYTFRRQARMNEIINITLDRNSDHKSFTVATETKADSDTAGLQASAVNFSTDCAPDWFADYVKNGSAPNWFATYMQNFKQELLFEINTSLDSCMDNLKAHLGSISSSTPHPRRVKESKRAHKYIVLSGESGKEKEFSKLERKLETKLEKLEHKTKKIKEKKLALENNQNVSKTSSSGTYRVLEDLDDVAPKQKPVGVENPLSEEDTDLYRLRGVAVGEQRVSRAYQGELFEHTWEIRNDSSTAWNNQFELRFTWGSKSLIPLSKIVPCPHLKPKEIGKVTVQMVAPDTPGSYESYWHLYYCGKRFGDWFGCQVIVESSLAGKTVNTSNITIPEANAGTNVNNVTQQLADLNITCSINENLGTFISQNGSVANLSDEKHLRSDYIADSSDALSEEYEDVETKPILAAEQNPVEIRNRQSELQGDLCHLSQTANTVEKDSDSENLMLDSSSTTSSIVKVENEIGNGSSETDNEKIDSSDENKDMVFISFDTENQAEEYAYVFVDDKRIPVPKKYLRPDYLESAEDAPNPLLTCENSENKMTPVPSSDKSKITVPQQIAENIEVKQTDEESDLQSSSNAAVVQEAKGTNDDLKNILSTMEIESNKMYENHAGFIHNECNMSQPNYMNNSCFMTQNPNLYASHCSATGSCYSDATSQKNSRLFIFPHGCPGYEVVPPRSSDDSLCLDGAQEKNETSPSYQLQSEYQHSQGERSVSNPQYPQSDYDKFQDIMAHKLQSDLSTSPTNHCNRIYPHLPNFQQMQGLSKKCSPETLPSEFCINKQPTHQHENVHDMFDSYNYVLPQGMSDSCRSEVASSVHILPETLVTGAVNVASSAINTARSVINMITRPEPGRWINGHWVSNNAETPREANLRQLAEMGFFNRDLNATLLARYNDDIVRVISELIQ